MKFKGHEIIWDDPKVDYVLAYTEDGYPVQVKRTKHTGRLEMKKTRTIAVMPPGGAKPVEDGDIIGTVDEWGDFWPVEVTKFINQTWNDLTGEWENTDE